MPDASDILTLIVITVAGPLAIIACLGFIGWVEGRSRRRQDRAFEEYLEERGLVKGPTGWEKR